MAVRILVIALAPDLDALSELSSILGEGYEVTFIRGADRQKLDMALDGRTQYDVVHLIAHGCESQIGTADGPVSEIEIVSLLESQSALRFVIVAACDSYEIVGSVHNALHVPVIGYNAPIDDKAAVEFSRTFYRAWRRASIRGAAVGDPITYAVERARASLAVLYPTEARKVRLINGNVLPSIVANSLTRVDTQLAVVKDTTATAMARQERLLRMMVVGLTLLLIAQLITPVVQLWLR